MESKLGEIDPRSFADDDDDDEIFGENVGLAFERTQAGEKFANESSENSYLCCVFDGKIALGFGEGYVGKQKNQFELLANVFFTGNEGTVDFLTARPKRRPVVRVFRGSGHFLFVLVDLYALPRSFINDVTAQIQEYITLSKSVVIFHSEPNVFYRRIKDKCEGKLFYVKTSTFSVGDVPKPAVVLPQPNLISGISASVLVHCEMMEKPGVMLATYCESELVDSISMRPFFLAVQNVNKSNSDSETKKLGNLGLGLNLRECFSQLTHSIDQSVKCNVNHVSESNLYV